MLKKSLFALFLGVFVLTGCSQKETAIEKTEGELKDAPQWVLVPEVKGFISAVGSAPANAGGDFAFQREEAMNDARNQLASQIEVKVNNMFKSFKGVTGGGSDATFDKSSEQVSKQIASQTLHGTKIRNTWINENQTLYVLMIIDTQSVKDYMGKAIKTSFKNDQAMHQKYLAAIADGQLDKELEKLEK
jgi:hypothetical protein